MTHIIHMESTLLTKNCGCLLSDSITLDVKKTVVQDTCFNYGRAPPIRVDAIEIEVRIMDDYG